MTGPEVATILGENVRRHRQDRGLTQADLAKRARTARERVSEVERAQGCVTIATVAKLAAALGVPVAELFQEAGVPA